MAMAIFELYYSRYTLLFRTFLFRTLFEFFINRFSFQTFNFVIHYTKTVLLFASYFSLFRRLNLPSYVNFGPSCISRFFFNAFKIQGCAIFFF